MHADYKRDGVCLIQNLFSPTEVNLMRACAYSALMKASEENPYRSGGRMQMRGKYPALMFWPSLIDEYLNEVRMSLAGLVADFLGPDVKQLNNQVYFRLPGDADAFAWHQDAMFRKGFSGGPHDYIQTIIAIDEMNKDNGGIGFVLGSHECKDLGLVEKSKLRTETGPPTIFESLESERPMPIKYFHAMPGDVLVWSHMTVHGSGQNKSNRSRMSYMNGFAKASACDGWPWYMEEGKLVTNADTDAIPYS